MRCLIVDDHPLTRDGTASALREVAPDVRTSEAGSLAQALEALAGGRDIELVLLDLELEDSAGLDTLRRLRAWCDEHERDVRVVVVSGHAEPELVREVVEHHATGFILKATPRHVFAQAVALTLAGGIHMPDVVLRRLEGAPADRLVVCGAVRPVQLTRRETEIVALLVHGYTSKRIAKELGHRDGRPVSDHTIRAHVGNVAWKLGVTTNAKSGVMAEIARLGITFPLRSRLA